MDGEQENHLGLGCHVVLPMVGLGKEKRARDIDPDFDDFFDLAIQAESAGFDALFMEAKTRGVRTETIGVQSLDPFVVASKVAHMTTSIGIGVVVSQEPPSRAPSIVAREATTLDIIAKGRAMLWFRGKPENTSGAIAKIKDIFAPTLEVARSDVQTSSLVVNRPAPFRPGGPLVLATMTSTRDQYCESSPLTNTLGAKSRFFARNPDALVFDTCCDNHKESPVPAQIIFAGVGSEEDIDLVKSLIKDNSARGCIVGLAPPFGKKWPVSSLVERAADELGPLLWR